MVESNWVHLLIYSLEVLKRIVSSILWHIRFPNDPRENWRDILTFFLILYSHILSVQIMIQIINT